MSKQSVINCLTITNKPKWKYSFQSALGFCRQKLLSEKQNSIKLTVQIALAYTLCKENETYKKA